MPYKDPEKNRACSRAWAERNRDKIRARSKTWNDKHRAIGGAEGVADRRAEKAARLAGLAGLTGAERKKAYHKLWRDANRERVLGYRRKQDYGITPDQVRALYEQQNEACALCLSPCLLVGGGEGKRGPRRGVICVDHDHDTGRVRALLCHDCNNGLGRFRDNPELLRAAALYVERFRT